MIRDVLILVGGPVLGAAAGVPIGIALAKWGLAWGDRIDGRPPRHSRMRIRG